MFNHLEASEKLYPLVQQVESRIEGRLKEIGKIVEQNQWRVLDAYHKHEVGDHHFTPSTGYGYDDLGRETLEKVYAHVFGTEAAIVRQQIISGTHAIATCLFGLLRPEDELIYITGKPYDTLDKVIGDPTNPISVPGSLAEFGVKYKIVELLDTGQVDKAGVVQAMTSKTKVIGIQRSKGYANRPSFTVAEIAELVKLVKEVNPNVIVFVDNCYGEFVELEEPTHVGADIMAGSLIKNPGGGLVKSGGYIVGRKELIELAGTRLAAPGIGLEGGASLYSLLEMYQGLFLAPHVVGEALKGAVFSSALLTELGFNTTPKWDEPRTDLIQAIQFDQAEALIAFCQGVQKAAPINSYVTPYPSAMPGYEDEVIMAAGTFIQGASIEFSADGPLRPPYLGFVQGGLTFEHVKIGVLTALNELNKKGLLLFK
ncbi:aminotransferase class I/II-fold pyridoxal phosphate-dependent enzyme [Bacillus horti]|uniref:Cystathionine beta-lyase family protein involved in aluminum resistance n=1 Tax=Caldalkalibacillus horti TaxID=77523 RepID=A0ABT9VV21_9BACI|nr:methionine gamma-lyase family protein [Bacillus horti]MDQ0164841.1 cystathionine beta-lyase family protein involved in aluminum resistance [Bacillus horti]